jgi:arylsulfatase A-like enzyme
VRFIAIVARFSAMRFHLSFARVAFIAALLLWYSTLAASALAAVAPRPPNIIFILADDIGYGDFGCYGATKVKTPHVDQLAREGIRLTDAHATASVCTPTRYSFITGQYAFRNPGGDHILSGEAPLSIDATKPTIASVLKTAGYATGQVGKWHLGLGRGNLDYNTEIKPGPLELGFDHAFFIPATGDRVPCVFVRDHKVEGLDPRDPIEVSYRKKIGDEPTGREHPELLAMKPQPGQGHLDTIINGISRIGFIAGGHTARWTDTEMANVLNREAAQFIESNKERPFFLYFATHDIHVPRVPHDTYKGKSQCGVRGDVIEEFDGSVAKVMEALDRLKIADNTLLIVTSDNGGVMEDGYMDGSIANANGHLCNGRLRGYKGSLWEGGHREPFIARWPGKIKAGTTSNELIGLVDMLATFAAAAGVDLPADAGPDSFNILPVLLGQPQKMVRDCLVLQNYNGRTQALRQGQWKFIPAEGPQARPQLYDLASDLGETKNLAQAKPEVVAKMQEKLRAAREAKNTRP